MAAILKGDDGRVHVIAELITKPLLNYLNRLGVESIALRISAGVPERAAYNVEVSALTVQSRAIKSVDFITDTYFNSLKYQDYVQI